MLQPLPPLVCHWANITHHISVRICQFLPLSLRLQSTTDLSLYLDWVGVRAHSTAAAPVKNWEDFNTSSLLMMTGAGPGRERCIDLREQLYLDLIIPSHHPVSSCAPIYISDCWFVRHQLTKCSSSLIILMIAVTGAGGDCSQ